MSWVRRVVRGCEGEGKSQREDPGILTCCNFFLLESMGFVAAAAAAAVFVVRGGRMAVLLCSELMAWVRKLNKLRQIERFACGAH